MGNNNGYKVAFWVMATIATLGLMTLAGAVVNNDRLRASEDGRIEYKMEGYRTERNTQYTEIIQRLTRIETFLKIPQK